MFADYRALGVRGLGVMLVATAALFSCAASETEADFTEALLTRFERAYPSAKFEIEEPLVVRRNKGGENELAINLHRIWEYCKNVPDDCERVRAEYIEKIAAIDEPKPEPGQFRIIVRDQQYVDNLDAMAKQNPDKPVTSLYERIGDDLYAILAADYPGSIALVGQERLNELKLANSAAFAQAFRQTQAALPAIPTPASIQLEGAVLEGKEYLATLLYDRAAWRGVSDIVGPDMFVTVVSDKFVFAGILPDGERLERFAKTVEEDCKVQERCVSPNIYRFRNGRWVLAR